MRYQIFSKSDDLKNVASVGVINKNGQILMGQRRDSNRWTLPGGHFEIGETGVQAAQRELYEEAKIGVPPHKFKPLGVKKVLCEDGKYRVIHSYKIKYDGPTSIAEDPDEEVKRWRWVSLKEMPSEIMDNLHARKNTVLQALGAKAIEKSFVVMDLFKSKSHKYLRKFKRGGSWVYIYNEPDREPRVLEDVEVEALKVLKERNLKNAKNLFASAKTVDDLKMKALLELSSRGNEQAIAKLKEWGIDHVQETLMQEMAAHPLKGQSDKATKNKVAEALMAARSSTIGHLEGHDSSEPSKKIVTKFGSMAAASDALAATHGDSIHDTINNLHEWASKVDEAHASLFNGDRFESQNSSAKDAKGYGNLAVQTFIKKLESSGVLPEGYSEVLTRTSIPDPRKIEEERRAKQEAARERLRAENESLYESFGTSMENMVSYFNKSPSDEERVKLMKGIKNFWGENFDWNEFQADLQGHDKVEIKIGGGFYDGMMGSQREGQGSFSLRLNLVEKSTGRNITSASRSVSKKSDGSIHWSNGSFSRAGNEDLKRFPGMATGMYGGVYRFLKKVTRDYTGDAKANTKVTIGQAANSGFGNGYKGALVWAKHFFDWQGASRASSWKGTWNNYLDKYNRREKIEGLDEIKAKLEQAKYPHDFVYTGYTVTKEQAKKLLGRSSFDHDFNQIFEKKGFVDIGDLIMIDSDTSWSAEAYINKDDARSNALRPLREGLYENTGVRPAGRTGATPVVTTAVSRATRDSTGSSAQSSRSREGGNEHERQAGNYMRYWRPSGNRSSITMTAARLRTMGGWPTERVQAFLRMATLSPNARRKVREIIRNR